MKRTLAIAGALLLAACATSAPPPGTLADPGKLAAATAPGATRASVLAALGPTRGIAFDSGSEVWLYQVARPGRRFAEYVVLFDHAGLVSKTRLREPSD
jgi:hypothetical protein